MQRFLVPKTKLDKTLLLRAAVLARQLDGCGTDEIFHRGEICPTIHSKLEPTGPQSGGGTWAHSPVVMEIMTRA